MSADPLLWHGLEEVHDRAWLENQSRRHLLSSMGYSQNESVVKQVFKCWTDVLAAAFSRKPHLLDLLSDLLVIALKFLRKCLFTKPCITSAVQSYAPYGSMVQGQRTRGRFTTPSDVCLMPPLCQRHPDLCLFCLSQQSERPNSFWWVT